MYAGDLFAELPDEEEACVPRDPLLVSQVQLRIRSQILKGMIMWNGAEELFKESCERIAQEIQKARILYNHQKIANTEHTTTPDFWFQTIIVLYSNRGSVLPETTKGKFIRATCKRVALELLGPNRRPSPFNEQNRNDCALLTNQLCGWLKPIWRVITNRQSLSSSKYHKSKKEALDAFEEEKKEMQQEIVALLAALAAAKATLAALRVHRVDVPHPGVPPPLPQTPSTSRGRGSPPSGRGRGAVKRPRETALPQQESDTESSDDD